MNAGVISLTRISPLDRIIANMHGDGFSSVGVYWRDRNDVKVILLEYSTSRVISLNKLLAEPTLTRAVIRELSDVMDVDDVDTEKIRSNLKIMALKYVDSGEIVGSSTFIERCKTELSAYSGVPISDMFLPERSLRIDHPPPTTHDYDISKLKMLIHDDRLLSAILRSQVLDVSNNLTRRYDDQYIARLEAGISAGRIPMCDIYPQLESYKPYDGVDRSRHHLLAVESGCSSMTPHDAVTTAVHTLTSIIDQGPHNINMLTTSINCLAEAMKCPDRAPMIETGYYTLDVSAHPVVPIKVTTKRGKIVDLSDSECDLDGYTRTELEELLECMDSITSIDRPMYRLRTRMIKRISKM